MGSVICLNQAGGMVRLTEWSMLKRKDHDILDSFDWERSRVTGESFAYDDLDAPNIVIRILVILGKQLTAKRRETETVGLASF